MQIQRKHCKLTTADKALAKIWMADCEGITKSKYSNFGQMKHKTALNLKY